MSVPQELPELVERFNTNREAYRSGQYNETQLRREFIDPLFQLLGWDVNNEKGYAEAYKDVIHEDSIKIGGLTKAPDYCFRIGGVRKFFVETKRPSVNLKDDISPAFQLRRYAWSAKLPLSILTDFEEFAVYDCRVKPNKTDKASTARIIYISNCIEFTQHWDEIASIFSREAVLKGSFDRYAESSKAKKGTAEVDTAFLKEIESWRDALARNLALRNPDLSQHDLNFAVQRTIDRIIFLRICEDRGIEQYGKLMALQNGDRMYERLCELFYRADERYNSGLFHFQKEKDRSESPDTLTPNLGIDDGALRDIIKNLYYPDSPYEFSVLSADILGQVYEQFLGKVIRLTAGHRAVIEEKPEVRKAGGVYYTPTYIVDYIVKNTVGKLLEYGLQNDEHGKIPLSKGGAGVVKSPLTKGEMGVVNPQNPKSKIKGVTPKEVSKIRILDPACGSGSFLLGAYQYLLDWHRDWYVANDPEKWATGRSPALYQVADSNPPQSPLIKGDSGGCSLAGSGLQPEPTPPIAAVGGVDGEPAEKSPPWRGLRGGSQNPKLVLDSNLSPTRRGDRGSKIRNWQLTTAERRRILLNNIYGVDIDPQAVEVTKLSLLLKVLEGESEQTIIRQLKMFHERALPDLGNNIKCGNSLIGTDFYNTPLNPLLIEGTSGHSPLARGAGGVSDEERYRINPFDWENEFPEIMKAGGFDAVIGNPPYVRIQTLQETSPVQVAYFKYHYRVAGSGNYDIYVVFVEKGLSLLNERGRLGFILPHKFFNAKYGEALRGMIAEGRHIGHVVHFGDQQVFDGATTYTALMFLDKRGNHSFEFERVTDLKAWQVGNPQIRGEIRASTVTAANWNFTVGQNAALFERLSLMPVKLGDVAEKIAQGIRTSANEVYVLDVTNEGKDIIKAYSKQLDHDVCIERKALSLFLQGREIKSYRTTPSGKMVIIPYRSREKQTELISELELKEQLPKTYAYLLQNKKFLEERECGRMKGGKWYAYIYPKNIEVMTSPKILVPDIADRAAFALDESGEYAFTSGYGITLKQDARESIKYILGLLNSRLVTFYLKQITTPLQNGFFRYFTQFVEPLPIRPINFSDPADKTRHNNMVAFVDQMLSLHKQLASAKTDHDKTVIQRQIDVTDRQIDQLVYELYGLTEKEINIVEEGSP